MDAMCNDDDSSLYLVHVLDWRLALREGVGIPAGGGDPRKPGVNSRINLWRTAKITEMNQVSNVVGTCMIMIMFRKVRSMHMYSSNLFAS